MLDFNEEIKAYQEEFWKAYKEYEKIVLFGEYGGAYKLPLNIPPIPDKYKHKFADYTEQNKRVQWVVCILGLNFLHGYMESYANFLLFVKTENE